MAGGCGRRLTRLVGVWRRHGLEQRRWGLAGIWGPLIRQWLHDLLPHDAADRCNGRVGGGRDSPLVLCPRAEGVGGVAALVVPSPSVSAVTDARVLYILLMT